ncbi:MAG: G8 domain-containing protein [Gemmatimonadales bacterium]
MRHLRPDRSAFRSLALGLLLAGCAVEPTTPGNPPPPPPPPPSGVLWSDPAAWGAAGVPVAGAEVVIPEGTAITLDVSPPALKSLTVNGTLTFGNTDLALTSGWIVVGGTFRIGTEAEPHHHKAVITLTGPATDNIMGMGARVLGVMGGTLDLHGTPRTSWTTLDASAAVGAIEITLAKATNWKAGDRIVIASTDLNPLWADEVVVASVAGRTVTLTTPLKYAHWGTVQSISGKSVDQRAEVGLLSRNIVIQGDPLTSPSGLGGHLMVMRGSTARIEGVEFYLMGQTGIVARYPIHWHMADAVDGQYARSNSIWKTRSRCVTIHGTDNLVVEDNVCYDHLGHGYFLEDGSESGNTLERNLGVLARRPAVADRILASDATPATFWITNPANRFIANVAAGSQGHGFWFALPVAPTGLSTGQPDRPTFTALGAFVNNVAHSNTRDGLFVDQGPLPDGTTATTSYRPRQDPNAASPAVVAVFENFTAWKNANRGVWLRGSEHRLAGGIFSDNKIGATFASSLTWVEDATFIGQTDNSGGTQVAAAFPIRGFEFYDGQVGARRVTFINYPSGGGRIMSAIGFNRSNAFALSPLNAVEQVSFINSNRVYIENPNATKDGDKSAVFRDTDGSVTGTPGHVVAAVNPLHVNDSCAFRAEWNAYDCSNRFLRLQVRGLNGEVIGPAVVRRDDGAQTTYVGNGNDPANISVSLPVGRSYQVTPGATLPTRPRFFATGMVPGEWIRVTIPYPGPTVRVSRDYSTTVFLPAAANLAALDASSGNTFFWDQAAGLLHLKLQAQDGRDYAVAYVVP